MKELHWSKIYVSFITVEVTYSDGARQGWDYDCSQFSSLEAMKANMSADFVTRRPDWQSLMLYVTKNTENYSGELDVTDANGDEFVEYVFDAVEVMINGD